MQALVVDDSAIYRKLIGDHLRSWGFGVTLAETGAEGRSILRQPDTPRLVLLDWVLPDIDGIELCQRIRQGQGESSGSYTYVILLTSKEGRQNMLEAMRGRLRRLSGQALRRDGIKSPPPRRETNSRFAGGTGRRPRVHASRRHPRQSHGIDEPRRNHRHAQARIGARAPRAPSPSA